MSIARRRFFKMAAAPAVAGVTPALAAPMVEMVEADIAPVPLPPRDVWHWVGGEAAPIDVMQSGIRARMVEIARQSDADVEEALRSHLQEIIDG